MVRVSKSINVRGFSLVEVLISLAILMMILFIGNLAYRTYSVYWYKDLGKFQTSVSELKGLLNVQDIIRNIKPMVLKGGKEGAYVYFEGGDSLIRAIGNEAIVNADVATVFELMVVPDNDISVRLEYKEFPISSTPVIYESDIGSYHEKIVVLRGFEDIRFEYYGWPNYSDFLIADNTENEILQKNDKLWFGLYSGKDSLISPEIVKLRLRQDGIWSEIDIPLTHFDPSEIGQFIGRDL